MHLGKNIRGYVLTNWLGSGGMGEVYQAVHQTTRRQAAVKILFHTDQVARFRNEAYIQASIQHPNIATLYEFAMEEENPCIIMEYVEGITLEKLIKRQSALPETFVWKVMEQIASAVAHLHEQQIIHRELKPGNIKVTRESLTKLLDFGIAKSAYTPKLTQEGYIIGTLHYMAPEQFSGKVSIQSDCWTIGVLFYEMITGSLPFDGRSETEVRVKIEKGQYTAPDLMASNISNKTKRLIGRLLRVKPEHRLTSQALLEALQNPGKDDFRYGWWQNLGEIIEKIPVKHWFGK
jgi:serine/threonine protein kinase